MLTPLEQHCLDAVKKWGGGPTYSIKNALHMDKTAPTATTAQCLRALKLLERRGLVRQSDRSQRQYVWALARKRDG